MPDHRNPGNSIEATRKLLQSVPVYQDMLQPAAKEVGRGLETVAQAVNVALAPLRAIVWGYDRIEAYVIAALAQKLKDVPENQIITPSLPVAGPTVEALRFAGFEPTLRELYANLLATSMARSTASKAHPAFVEIIRQLTPDEARIVHLFASSRIFPLVTVIADTGEGWHPLLQHFGILGEEADCEHPDAVATYVGNLCRLGIAHVPESQLVSDPDAYTPLDAHPVVKTALEDCHERGCAGRVTHEALVVTTLGERFCEACVGSAREQGDDDGGDAASAPDSGSGI